MFFDASDTAVGSANIDALHVVDGALDGSGQALLSFAGTKTLPGIGRVDDSDVVRFSGTFGANTSGSFELVIDGSDISLTSGGEDIDALSSVDESLLFSTLGTANLALSDNSTLVAADEDLTSFTATSTGTPTAGTFTRAFDGSLVGLASEDLNAIHLDNTTGFLYGSTQTPFSAGGFAADTDDVWVFLPSGSDLTEGSFSVIFDGDAVGFNNENIDALHIGSATSGAADLAITVADSSDPTFAGSFTAYNVDVTNNGPDTVTDAVLTVTNTSGLTINPGGVFGCVGDFDGQFCALPDIASGAAVSVLLNAQLPQDAVTEVSARFRVFSSLSDNNLTNNETTESTGVLTGPTANPDGPSAGSVPGDPFHTSVGVALDSGPAENVLQNDDLGTPEAEIVSFGGLDLTNSVEDVPVGTTVFGPNGRVSVQTDGSFLFVPNPDFEGSFSFQYRLRGQAGQSDGQVTILVGEQASRLDSRLIYLSTTEAGTVDGISYGPEDVLSYSPRADKWSLFLDMSQVGLGSANVDAIEIGEGFGVEEIRLSFSAPITIPGVGLVDDSDVIQFGAESFGTDTAGTFFGLDLDGSTVGLRSGGEDVDAFDIGPGAIFFSTIGSGSVPKPGGGNQATRDEDLVSVTGGDLAVWFDGSDLGLAAADLSSASFDTASGDLLGTSIGGFSTPDLSGDGNDVFAFAGTGGADTSGTLSLFFDAGSAGLGDMDIDALQVVRNTNTLPLQNQFCGNDLSVPYILPAWLNFDCGTLLIDSDRLPRPGELTGVWNQISGPASATVQDPTSPQTIFLITEAVPQEYRYEVTDGELTASPLRARFAVTVADVTSPCAGATFEVTLPDTLSLDCPVEYTVPSEVEPDFEWRGTADFSDRFAEDPTVTFNEPGQHVLHMLGRDNEFNLSVLVNVLPAPAGTLGGQFWVDGDGDGVRDPVDSFIRLGSQVTLTAAGDDGTFGTEDDVISLFPSAFSRWWFFTGLPDGDYRVSITPPPLGFTRVNVGDDQTVDSDVDPSTQEISVTLNGTSKTDLDVGILSDGQLGGGDP